MHIRSKAQSVNHRPTAQPRERADRTDRTDRTDRAPSSAWLAAQEAFSAPRPVAAEPALVVVRKGRATEAEPSADAACGAAPAPAERPARVFRVVGAATGLSAKASSASAAETSPRGVPARARQRRRRVDVHKDPGPVLHILQAPRVAAQRAAEPPQTGMSPGEEIAALQVLMRQLDEVFGAISQARAFHLPG